MKFLYFVLIVCTILGTDACSYHVSGLSEQLEQREYDTGSSMDSSVHEQKEKGEPPLVEESPPENLPSTWVRQTNSLTTHIADIAIDSKGNILITGSFDEYVELGNFKLKPKMKLKNQMEIFIAKLSPKGQWLWAKRAGGLYSDFGSGIAVDSQDNVFVTGSFQVKADFGKSTHTGVGKSDIFIAKLNSAGNWLWSKSAGSKQNDGGSDIAVDHEGSVFVVGSFGGLLEFGGMKITPKQKNGDVFIAKLTADSRLLWIRQVEGKSGPRLALDQAGNAFITGAFASSIRFGHLVLKAAGEGDVFVSKLSGKGEWLWAKSTTSKKYAVATSIAVGPNGNVAIAGVFLGVVHFGTITLKSRGYSSTQNFAPDAFVAKLNSKGEWVWVRSAGSKESDGVEDVIVDKQENVFLTGYFFDSAEFGGTRLSSKGGSDIFLSKLDRNGKWLWSKRAGSLENDHGYCVALGQKSHLITAGGFEDKADFGDVVLSLKPTSRGESYVWKVRKP